MIPLFALLAATLAVPTTHPPADVRCAIALGYVTDIVTKARGRRIVFSTNDVELWDIANSGWFEARTDFIDPKPIPAPSRDLVDRLRHERGNAVRLCSSVRRFLKERGIEYGAKATKAARTRGVFKAYIQSVTLPVVSDDQRRSLLERNEVRGFTDGGGWFELLERQSNGEWKATGFRPTWMS